MIPGILSTPPRSILLVRLSARGDIVFSSPLVKAFRDAYPDATITWMAESHTKDLIENHPLLDDVIVVNRAGWKQMWKDRRFGTILREMKDLVGELRRRQFDLAVDLQGLLKSGVLTYLSGAPVRVGLRSKEASGALMTHVLSEVDWDRGDIGSEYRFLARELGLEVGDFRMTVPLGQTDRDWAEKKVAELGLRDGFFVALPFTTRPQKHWREPRWAQLLDQVKEELGIPGVLLGGPGDREALNRILGMSTSGPVSLVGETSLTQASAMVERASLVVGVDTGLTHMAIAFERPTVTIFGANIPYTKTPTDREKVIVNWLECSPCRHNPTCNGAFTCTELIAVDQVMETAKEVLANARRVEAEGVVTAGDGDADQ
jgi:heptosyltransferase-1